MRRCILAMVILTGCLPSQVRVPVKALPDPGIVFQSLRDRARLLLDGYYGNPDSFEKKLQDIRFAYDAEVTMACTHGAPDSWSEAAVDDVRQASAALVEETLLFLLLDKGCALKADVRREAVAAAAHRSGIFEYVLQHAIASRWGADDKRWFISLYTMSYDCSHGFAAAAALHVSDTQLRWLIKESQCETPVRTEGWAFPREKLRQGFLISAEERHYVLALAFGSVAETGDDDLTYLAGAIFARHDEYAVTALLVAHPALRDALYAYAIERGRARYVGLQAKEIYWEERAFRRLLEYGRYEDAAEVAEYGVSLTMRTEGILAAFRAAAADGGDFLTARALWRRYRKIISVREFENARADWNLAHPQDTRFRPIRMAPKRAGGPGCGTSESGDWTVKRCDR